MNPFASKTALFQWVDHWFGGFCCGVLTLARRVCQGLGLEKSPAKAAGRRGLLFLKLAEQGSTVLAAAALQDAVNRHGKEHVYFLVFEENRFILESLGILRSENILSINTRGFHRILATGLAQLARVRALQLAECVDMEFFARATSCFAYLTGIPRRVGFHSWFGEGPWRGDLLTHRLRYNPHVHTAVIFRELVAAAAVEDPRGFPRFDWVAPEEHPPVPSFQPTEAEVTAMRELIHGHTEGRHRALVLLNANASDLLPLRRWDNENYLQLARRLLADDPELFIAFTGGPDEAEKIRGLVGQLQDSRVFCTAGRTTLRELLALYGLADVLVTNDSGPAHFAALTGIRTVVLFGPETPKLFGSLGPDSISLTAGLACSPCVSALNNRQTSCTNNLCMQRITVDQVLEAVRGALAARGKSPAEARSS
jgi:ADP-heptose:LPS heptosyltransferase